MDNWNLRGIQAAELDSVWEAVLPWVEGALERGSPNCSEEIYEKLKGRKQQLWVIYSGLTPRAIFVTEILVLPTHKIMFINLCGGAKVELWFDAVMGVMEDFARSQHCLFLYMQGRVGWQKFLKVHDWKLKRIIMGKEIV